MTKDPIDVLDVWWSLGEDAWFAQSDEVDAMLSERFADHVAQARAGRLETWTDAPHTALALMLLLDQFPRNIFRGTANAFASDPQALTLAATVRARRFDKAYHGMARSFFYLPYMHAEDIDAQSISCDLYRALGNQNAYHYALIHMDAIRRFGRFPHRNKVLGRVSTPQEEAYLASGGFSA